MERLQVYCARNPIKIESSYNAPVGSILSAIIYTKDNSGNFTLPVNADAPLLSTKIKVGNFSFQIEKLLSNSILFTNSGYSTSIASRVFPLILPVKIKYQLVNSTEAAVWSDIIYITNCKIKRADWKKFGDQFLKNGFISNSYLKFLSTAPAIKSTSFASKEYLYFMFNINPSPAMKLMAEIFTNTSQKHIVLDNITPQQYQVFEFDVSASKVYSMAGNSIITSFRYNIYLADSNGNQISEKRMFVLDPVQNEDEELLLFRNLLGVWDTVRLIGRKTISQEVQRLTFEDENYQRTDYFQEAFEKITLRTGNLDHGFLEYLGLELLVSPEIYLVRDGNFTRLNCLSNSIETYNPTNAYESAAIEFRINETETF